MTFIQPNKNHSLLNKILILLISCLVVGAFWLIVLYNDSVNLNHEVTEMKADFQVIQAQNVSLKEKIFGLSGPESFGALAGKRNLVQDKKPQYIEVSSKWSYASQY